MCALSTEIVPKSAEIADSSLTLILAAVTAPVAILDVMIDEAAILFAVT